MSSRVDEAWSKDPRLLWSIILEDEAAKNAAELGEIAEHLFVNAQEAWFENARLRVQVHDLSGRLNRAGCERVP
jgi:hypothetical protein